MHNKLIEEMKDFLVKERDFLNNDDFENISRTIEIINEVNSMKEYKPNGELVSCKKEKGTTEQVEEGLLKIFNGLIESGEYSIGNYDFDNEKYSTSICQIADRLLQIESARKLREEYYKNCTID